MDRIVIFEHLGIALAIGLLIGTERGWHEREAAEGQRVAGIRTFALAGLLGGLIGLASVELSESFAGLSFAGFTALVVASHWLSSSQSKAELGITTEVALLLTFALGLLSSLGYPLIAAASAVVVTILLGLKSVLHAWLDRLTGDELHAAMKFLLISVVMLPLLPNEGYGPWQAFNPHLAWWMVVLVSGISFIGYFAIKLAGPRRGIMATSLLGGLVSSTAVTLSMSRHAAARHYAPRLLAGGILAACGVMFPRALIEATAINPELLASLAAPLITMTLTTLFGAVWLWHSTPKGEELTEPRSLPNPFELGTALKFGLLLSTIMVLASGAREWFGDYGLYALAFAAGLGDVDALTLSTAKLSLDGLALETARNAILIAIVTNSTVKVLLACFIGTIAVGMRAALVILLASSLGLAALLV
ncbi:MAG: MgtC/SapB family protein [Pseudomonadota bacterium]